MNNRSLIYFYFAFALAGMIGPYLIFVGETNVFILDYHAKRLSFLLAGLPVLFFVCSRILLNRFPRIEWPGLLLMMLVASAAVIGLVNRNAPSHMLTEFAQLFFVLIVWAMLKCSDMTWNRRAFYLVLTVAVVCTLAGLKMQFSYASVVAVFLYFYRLGPGANKLLAIALFPLISLLFFQSMLGKSALLALVLTLVFLYGRWELLTVSRLAKVSLLVSIMVVGLSAFPSILESSAAYWKTYYFVSEFDLQSSSFDTSTMHRVFEAGIVLETLQKGGMTSFLFGQGLGASIDLSATADSSVIAAQTNIESTRNVHLLGFYLLLKFGVAGVIVFYTFLARLVLETRRVFLEVQRGDYSLTTKNLLSGMCFYVIYIAIDGQVSAAHLLSNSFFWLCAFCVLGWARVKVRKQLESGTTGNSSFEFQTAT